MAKTDLSPAEEKRAKRKQTMRSAVLLTVLFAFFSAVSAGGWVVYTAIRDLPPWQMDSLQFGAPSTLYAADGKTVVATLGKVNYIPVPQKEIIPDIKQALIAVEDTRFSQHPGVDPRGIVRALWTDLTHGKAVQGASTITQQLARNAFLISSKTLKRKIQEMFLAVQLERHYTKDEILALYLNRVYFGQGAWGIGAAARTYFNKNAADLGLAEAALLAGLVQAPSYYDPYRNPEEAVAKRNVVLDKMLSCGFITPEEEEQASGEPLNLDRGATVRTEYPYPDFTDYVIATVEKKYGESALFRGGLKIYTTLDIKAQRAVEEEIRNKNNFPPSERDANGLLQPQTAVVLLDPYSGSIRALAGGREHTVDRQFNRAVQAKRQPGSAFKPIIAYGPAIEYAGMSPEKTVIDEPVRYGSYVPKNADDKYRGAVTLQDALAFSVNVVAVELLDDVGLGRAVEFAGKLGIELDTANEGLSLALGGLNRGVTPLEMAAAYGAFANGGEYIRPTAVTRIFQPNGVILEEYKPERGSAMRRETARAITTMLRAAVRYGTGTGARIGTIAAGKTGTTDEGKDIWFCGWVPKMVGVVWIGWDRPKAMPRAYGGKYCAPLWRKIMLKAVDIEGIPSEPLPPRPKPVVPEVYGQETVPSVYGDTYGTDTSLPPGTITLPDGTVIPPGGQTPQTPPAPVVPPAETRRGPPPWNRNYVPQGTAQTEPDNGQTQPGDRE
ncbi:MAG: PBP1A family penicillin-binding protein [Bacillota bacterium]